MIVRVIENKNRAKEIFNSIKNVWYEIFENKQEQVYLLSFGSCRGSVLYVFESSKPFEVNEIIK